MAPAREVGEGKPSRGYSTSKGMKVRKATMYARKLHAAQRSWTRSAKQGVETG